MGTNHPQYELTENVASFSSRNNERSGKHEIATVGSHEDTHLTLVSEYSLMTMPDGSTEVAPL